MKKIILTILTLVLLNGLYSCGGGKDCRGAGADNINDIDFYNFILTDLDTIIIISYSKNTNFAIQIDSGATHAIEYYGNNYYTANTGRIKTDLDYKIKIISTGQVYTLVGFETERIDCTRCKKCPFNGPSDNYWNRLKSYLVNGQRIEGESIKIYH